MGIETTETMIKGVLVLAIKTARLDASNSPDLRLLLLERIEQGQGYIVLDLAAVSFMDSSALGALIAAIKRMGTVGMIGLARPTPTVARLLTLTRMDKVFTIAPSVEDAVAKIAD